MSNKSNNLLVCPSKLKLKKNVASLCKCHSRTEETLEDGNSYSNIVFLINSDSLIFGLIALNIAYPVHKKLMDVFNTA